MTYSLRQPSASASGGCTAGCKKQLERLREDLAALRGDLDALRDEFQVRALAAFPHPPGMNYRGNAGRRELAPKHWVRLTRLRMPTPPRTPRDTRRAQREQPLGRRMRNLGVRSVVPEPNNLARTYSQNMARLFPAAPMSRSMSRQSSFGSNGNNNANFRLAGAAAR